MGYESERDGAPSGDSETKLSQEPNMKGLYVLSIHDESFSPEDVLFNPSTGDNLQAHDLLQLTALKGDKVLQSEPVGVESLDLSRRHVFTYHPVTSELLKKQPTLQVSVSQAVANVFGFLKGNQVLVSTADSSSCYASHVEIVFRDQYLSRGDMWRLVSTVLTNTCVYKDQKVLFLGTIRASIKTIYVRGKRVASAFFHSTTKPVFRSESARYVMLIQMSKEMWEFDAEGTGEIMFDKVINGFLPELFKRWRSLKVRHFVSIVFFTRMVFERRSAAPLADPKLDAETERKSNIADKNTYEDFYRIVASDMASGEWADILNQLKREFKVFLRDISIRQPDAGDHLPLGYGLSSALESPPSHVIAGHPSSATRGNILEAINLASSQFFSDYIDRDLLRTGVSIVVVSPGSGLFEVDYKLLVMTTENLIDNGVGIDLVCLSKIPLHSIPLFKCQMPFPTTEKGSLVSKVDSERDERTPTGSFTTSFSRSIHPFSTSADSSPGKRPHLGIPSDQGWNYGVPHWVDISFWASFLDRIRKQPSLRERAKEKSSFDTPQHKQFIPRVKMYELQMMGVTENVVGDIAVPFLARPSFSIPIHSGSRTASTLVASPQGSLTRFGSQSSNMQSHDSTLRTLKSPVSFVSSFSGNGKGFAAELQWMDVYDDLLFRHPSVARKRTLKARASRNIAMHRQDHDYSPSALGSVSSDHRDLPSVTSASVKDDSDQSRGNMNRRGLQRRFSGAKSTSNINSDSQGRRPKIKTKPSQIKLGPRGFRVTAPKAVASTGISVDHMPGSLLTMGLKSQAPTNDAPLSTTMMAKTQQNQEMSGLNPQQNSSRSVDDTQTSESESPSSSRPIPIRNTTAIRVKADRIESQKPRGWGLLEGDSNNPMNDRVAELQNLHEHEQANPDDADVAHLIPVAESSTTLAPWLTIVNPCNPSRTNAAAASRLGKWQHVFPQPLRASQIKWKSLCSPAAVPLTTEEFPNVDQLVEDYLESSYLVSLPDSLELAEVSRSLVSEMISFRISRGFQIVVGPHLAETTKNMSFKQFNVFEGSLLSDIGTTIYMSCGSTIHQLTRTDTAKVQVKQFSRHSALIADDASAESLLYKPAIRAILAAGYDFRKVPITSQRGNFDWEKIDSFIVSHERPQAKAFVENLKPWRARFVLIPVDPPSSTRRPLHPKNEDDAEEIRLEGIGKLTQVWQRFRYIPPEERRFQAPLRNRKDTNPLDIMYQTRSPSAIVAAELENFAEGDTTGKPVQLLPDSDLFQRSNFKIAALTETIQSDRGVRMLDRRWHLRLHYNCFIGAELTTWLLQNFRDVDTRDEAVDLGNELMRSGLFKHVEERHNFRDGNYFYQIAGEYRAPRPESRGWFAKGKASVPSTPMVENVPKDLPPSRHSRSSSKSDSTSGDPTTPTRKKQGPTIALSKSLIYDVDHRKRSYRPELINLHYDRLHNPDDCYHIRIEWMNTTPKLIQDAVLSWATSVDRFGLRLVEIPLDEASSISNTLPFHAPLVIRLVQPPPASQPQSYFDTTSFTPQPRSDKNFYQKAIMKRFNFVLDYEAASDFPADVDVTYSWGRPEYRYPQYIHRSGTMIAQITDKGDFLLLTNSLYNNRSTAKQEVAKLDNPSDSDQTRSQGFFRSSPHRGTHRPSPRSSPYASPSVRATLDIPANSSNTSRGSSPANNVLPSTSANATTRSNTSASITTTPETIKREFEAFCNDKVKLEAFYAEVFSSKASTPGPSTPYVGGGLKTPLREPAAAPITESNIPTLALPKSIVSGRAERGDVVEKIAETVEQIAPEWHETKE